MGAARKLQAGELLVSDGTPGGWTVSYFVLPPIQVSGANEVALTDSTGGTPSTTLAAIAAGAGYTQADMVAVKNALASLAQSQNAVLALLTQLGLWKGGA